MKVNRYKVEAQSWFEINCSSATQRWRLPLKPCCRIFIPLQNRNSCLSQEHNSAHSSNRFECDRTHSGENQHSMRLGVYVVGLLLLAGCFHSNGNRVRIATVGGLSEYFPLF